MPGIFFSILLHLRIVLDEFNDRDLRFKVPQEDDDTSWIDCNAATSHGGIPISQCWVSHDDESIQMESDALYLFVIEKEGIFRRMCDDKFHLIFRCILVTGCGYPDVATRALVHRVKTRFPHIKVLGICDYNPHGLALLLTYKFGSLSMAFEGQGS